MKNWIPIEQGLPENDNIIMVQGSNGDIFPAWYDKDRKRWEAVVAGDESEDIIAWHPNPEAYVKPRRFVVVECVGRTQLPKNATDVECNVVDSNSGAFVNTTRFPNREAAERIADIYEEVYK